MMKRHTVTLSALILAAVALVGCSAEPTPPAAVPAPESTQAAPSPTPPETEAVACPYFLAKIHFGNMTAKINGKLFDTGPREFATGAVGLDDDGTIVSYTVAPGDAPVAIGDRLCIDYAAGLPQLNHVRTIQPGQVLRLRLDPDVPWVPYFNPHDAPEGFQQIPYQQAIEEMAAAGDADDVEMMRAIWNDKLKAMFTDPEVLDQLQQALDAGDPRVLNQMFS
jgi:hypothetical protein